MLYLLPHARCTALATLCGLLADRARANDRLQLGAYRQKPVDRCREFKVRFARLYLRVQTVRFASRVRDLLGKGQ